MLVSKCAESDWCAAAVFQCQNENAFREILLDVALCYKAIYALAKRRKSKDWNEPPQDRRQLYVFECASDSDVNEDKQDLQKRLDDLANGYTKVKLNLFENYLTRKVALKKILAKYLLTKMRYTPSEPQASSLDSYSAILWRKASEPPWTWGYSHFLGAGSGAAGVCSTTWLDIKCAKKVFHGEGVGSSFLKEAGILAHMKHPCIVNTMTTIGTTIYRAPEAHPMVNPDGGGKVNWFKADAFSFAMTCAHLLSLKTPSEDLKPSEMYDKVVKNAQRPELPEIYPQELVELLQDCWKRDPMTRPSFEEICKRLESYTFKLLCDSIYAGSVQEDEFHDGSV